MKALLMFLVVAFSLALEAGDGSAPGRYRFISFNIWGDYFGNPPHERDAGQLGILIGHAPDFIALQEMTKNFWDSKLVAGLEQRGYEAVGRDMGMNGVPSHTPLLYRRDRFEELERGGFLFHPELDRSKSVVWAAVKDRLTGAKLVVFSTHFWWKYDGQADDYVRMTNARDLWREVSRVADRHGAAIVGGGDLNAQGASTALLELRRSGLENAQETSPKTDKRATWRDFPVRDAAGVYRGVAPEKAKKSQYLDYIFYLAGSVIPL
jgi:endonuclease/exonuclease/phosphatase family metal-dependent hydrolase